MGSERVSDFLLQGANRWPIHRSIQVIPRIEIQHIRDSALGHRPQHTVPPLESGQIMEKPRVQTAAHNAISRNDEASRDPGNERDGIKGLQDVSLVAQH